MYGLDMCIPSVYSLLQLVKVCRNRMDLIILKMNEMDRNIDQYCSKIKVKMLFQLDCFQRKFYINRINN